MKESASVEGFFGFFWSSLDFSTRLLWSIKMQKNTSKWYLTKILCIIFTIKSRFKCWLQIRSPCSIKPTFNSDDHVRKGSKILKTVNLNEIISELKSDFQKLQFVWMGCTQNEKFEKNILNWMDTFLSSILVKHKF